MHGYLLYAYLIERLALCIMRVHCDLRNDMSKVLVISNPYTNTSNLPHNTNQSTINLRPQLPLLLRMAPPPQRQAVPSTSQTQPTTQTQTQPQTQTTAILRLRGAHESTGRSVQWREDVVDNEGLGRKKSKGKPLPPPAKRQHSNRSNQVTSLLHLPPPQSRRRILLRIK